jgi:hypothetical protein
VVAWILRNLEKKYKFAEKHWKKRIEKAENAEKGN